MALRRQSQAAAAGEFVSTLILPPSTRSPNRRRRSQVRRRRMSRVNSIDLVPVNGSCGLRPAVTSYPTFLRLACQTCSHARSPQGWFVRTTRSAPASYSRTCLRTRNITPSRSNSLHLTSSVDARPILVGAPLDKPQHHAGRAALLHIKKLDDCFGQFRLLT